MVGGGERHQVLDGSQWWSQGTRRKVGRKGGVCSERGRSRKDGRKRERSGGWNRRGRDLVGGNRRTSRVVGGGGKDRIPGSEWRSKRGTWCQSRAPKDRSLSMF